MPYTKVAQPATKTARPLNTGGLGEGAGYVAGKTAVGIAQGLEGIYDFVVGGIADLIGQDEFAKEQFEINPTQDWSRNLDLWYNPDGVMQFVGQVGESVGQMLPAVAIGSVTGGLGSTVAFGISASGRGVQQSVAKTGELGAKEWAYGVGSGALETAIETASGGIGGVGVGYLDDIARKVIPSNFIRSAIGEGLEEVASGIIDPYLQRVTYDKNAPLATIDELAHEFALGAVAGGVMSAAQIGVNVARYGQDGNKLNQEFNELQSLRNYQTRAIETNNEKRLNQLDAQVIDKIDSIQKIRSKMQSNGQYDSYAKKVDTKQMDWLENVNVQVLAAENSINNINKKYNTNYELVVFDAQTKDQNLEKAKASIDLEQTNGFTIGNKIYINRNTKQPYSVVLGHELKHTLESTNSYQELHDTVLNQIENKDELMEQKRKLYAGVESYESSQNKDYYIEQEVVADYVGNNLLYNYSQIKKLYASNRNVFSRIYEWIKERLGKTQTAPERESLIQVRDRFKKALQEVKQENQFSQNAIEKVETFISEQIANKRYEKEIKFSITDNSLVEKYYKLDLNQDISEMDGVPAIRLNDGSIISFESPHVTFIKNNDIDVNDIESGGWISRGQYESTTQSDTMRFVEQKRARMSFKDKVKSPLLNLEDSQGNPLTKEQVEFFKDSKARDENGNLLIVYHGSPLDFNVFDKKTIGKNHRESKGGFYFTDKFSSANFYAGNNNTAKPYYLNIKNPYVLNAHEDWYNAADYFDVNPTSHIAYATSKNHDGIIVKHNNGSLYLSFESNQIKLASNKNPTENDDIRFSLNSQETEYNDNQKQVIKGIANVFNVDERNIIESMSIPQAYENLKSELALSTIQTKLNNLGLYIIKGNEIRFSIEDYDFLEDYIYNASEIESNVYEPKQPQEIIDNYDSTIQNLRTEDIKNSRAEIAKEQLPIMRGYMHLFDLESIKDELRYTFGKDNTPFLMWGKKVGGMSFDGSFSDINSMLGNALEDSGNGKDNFINFHEYYIELLSWERDAAPAKKARSTSSKESESKKSAFMQTKSQPINEVFDIMPPKQSGFSDDKQQPKKVVKPRTKATIYQVNVKQKQLEPTLKDKATDQAIGLQVMLTDAQAGIVHEAKRLGSKKIESLTNYARASQSAAINMITEAQFDRNGKKVGEALNTIFKQVPKDLEAEFDDYLLHCHNIDRMAQEKAVFGEDVSATMSKYQAEQYEREHPEFKAIAEQVWQYNRNLLKYQMEHGVISNDLYELLNKMYPHYVPIIREVNQSVGTGAILGNKNMAVKSIVKKAKGGDGRIISVREAMMQRTIQGVKAARVNTVAKELHDLVVLNGDFKNVTVNEKAEKIEDIDALYDENIAKENEISYFENGERKTMAVNKLIYAGFKAFANSPSVLNQNILIRSMRKINSTFKHLVTSLNPFFLVRNTVRDLQDAGLYSRSLGKFMKNYPDAIKDIKNNSETWQMYKAMGGFQSSIFERTVEVGQMGSKKGLSGLLAKIESLNMITEQLPRFTEFKSSLERGKSPEEALYDSADVTVNFGRSGTVVKIANSTLIPFLNPSVQGFSKIWRTITGVKTWNEARTLFIKASLIGIAPAVLNALMYDDDDDYLDLNQRDKENNYLLKVNGQFLKLPRGRVAAVIGGLTQRAINAAKGDKDAFKGYAENVSTQISPVESFSRNIFSPFTDVQTNTTWYGTPIESAKFDSVSPRMRYDESTSRIAVELGKVMNYSPKKIHYLLDQYSGVIGDIVLPLTTPKAERDIVTQNFTINPKTQNKISQTFYDELEAANFDKSEGNMIGTAKVKFLNKTSSRLRELYNRQKEIMNSNLSDEDKKAENETLQVLINQVQKTALIDLASFQYELEQYDLSADEEIFTEQYEQIFQDVFGTERYIKDYKSNLVDRADLLSKAKISYDDFYDIYTTLQSIESDKDKEGNTINGTRKAKVESYVKTLRLSAAQKYLIMGLAGYKNTKGKVQVANYLRGLRLTQQEIELLLSMAY